MRVEQVTVATEHRWFGAGNTGKLEAEVLRVTEYPSGGVDLGWEILFEEINHFPGTV